MTLPYVEPLTIREPAARVVPEPLRPGDPGGEPCRVCAAGPDAGVWSDEHWVLHQPSSTPMPGTMWLSTRRHVDSFADLPPDLAMGFGVIVGRIERAILSLGTVGRVHVYRFGDGNAHFHVWFVARPLGMLDGRGPMLWQWSEVLSDAPDQALEEATIQIVRALRTAI